MPVTFSEALKVYKKHGDEGISGELVKQYLPRLPLSPGATVAVPQARIGVKEQIGEVAALRPGDIVEDLVKALNALRDTAGHHRNTARRLRMQRRCLPSLKRNERHDIPALL